MTVNPILKRIISLIDKDCPRDGNLILSSLRSFLGEPVCLCPLCSRVSTKMAKHLYRLGGRFLGMDRDFMRHSARHQFLDDQFGQAWFRGFGLVVKGVEKYGARIPFTPAGPFEIVWNFTYQCNLRCKHCYESARERLL